MDNRVKFILGEIKLIEEGKQLAPTTAATRGDMESESAKMGFSAAHADEVIKKKGLLKQKQIMRAHGKKMNRILARKFIAQALQAGIKLEQIKQALHHPRMEITGDAFQRRLKFLKTKRGPTNFVVQVGKPK